MTHFNDEPPRDGDASDLEPELRRVAEALRRMPAVRPGATARVVAAARGEHAPAAVPRRRISVGLTAAAAAVVVLASGIGLVSRREASLAAARQRDPLANASVDPVVVHGPGVASSATTLAMDPAGGTTYRTATLSESGDFDDAPVAVPFVLPQPGARRIALVGDFNGWSPTANPLRRTANGVWTVTVALTPGRHAFGYVVDDTLWVRDPRADVERDADFGRDHSVIVVGRP